MTHDEVSELLPGYAAASLDDHVAELVREHLATGCLTCLHGMFRLPVGAVEADVRAPVEPAAQRYPASGAVMAAWADAGPTRRRAARSWTLIVVAAGLVLLGLAVAVTLGDLRRGVAVRRQQTARLRTRLAHVADQRDGVARELESAKAERAQQEDALRAVGGERDQLRQDLEASTERVSALAQELRRRDAEVARLATATDGTLQDLLAAPGLQLMPLTAVPPYHDARGHVLWDPERDTLLVFAFGLLPERTYRVEVVGEGGLLAARQALPSGSRGEAAVPLHLSGPAGRVRALQVVLDPPGRAVLAGRRG